MRFVRATAHADRARRLADGGVSPAVWPYGLLVFGSAHVVVDVVVYRVRVVFDAYATSPPDEIRINLGVREKQTHTDTQKQPTEERTIVDIVDNIPSTTRAS